MLGIFVVVTIDRALDVHGRVGRVSRSRHREYEEKKCRLWQVATAVKT